MRNLSQENLICVIYPSYKSVIYPTYKSVIYPGRGYEECNLPQGGYFNCVIHPRMGYAPIGTYKAYTLFGLSSPTVPTSLCFTVLCCVTVCKLFFE